MSPPAPPAPSASPASPASPTPPVPRLFAISDRRSLPPGLPFDDWLRMLAAARRQTGGALAVQIREKDLDDRHLLELVRRARELLPAAVPVLVNGRPDLALAAGADGVHLPAAGLPVAAVRRCIWQAGQSGQAERSLLAGRSTHAPKEVVAARAEGADYVTFGPVYPTPSKAAYGPPPGLAGLAAAVRAGLPVIALGGVTPDRLSPLAAAGAHGAAAIRAFQEKTSAAAMLRGARRFG